MLSGETAAGMYPVEAVETMSRIVTRAKAFLAAQGPSWHRNPVDSAVGWGNQGWITPTTEAVVAAALLVVATSSGRTALAASKYRNATPTLALADDPETARAMALYRGVTPLLAPGIGDVEHALTVALDWARAHQMVKPCDCVVLVRGTIAGDPTQNSLLVREVV